MKIALDYDETYSVDPEFWNLFIASAKARGHEVRGVTARDDRFDRTAGLVELEQLIPVIYCRGIAKRWYCTHFVEDFVPEVWVDDNPEAVLLNSRGTPEDLAEWRAQRNEGPTL